MELLPNYYIQVNYYLTVLNMGLIIQQLKIIFGLIMVLMIYLFIRMISLMVISEEE